MPGPAPTPTATLGARGSWRAKDRKKKKKGVNLDVTIPVKPAGLSEIAAKEWDSQVESLIGQGILSRVDHAALACWCESWADFVEACEHVQTESKVVKGGMGGTVPNPWYKIRRDAMDAILKFSQQFGFTPSARVRVKAEGKKDDGGAKGKARYFKVAEGT